ncbi:type II toxin-antitoxin system RelE/ParE family toxin [Colwellia sp. RE-S-Sl-9]
MTSYTVTLTDNANKDLENIYQHYMLRADDKVADKLLSEIEEAIILLTSKPLLGYLPLELHSTDKDCLEMFTKSFRLIYKIEKQQVIILIVLHQKQSVTKAVFNRSLH